VDTRALVRHIRSQGAMRAVISSDNLEPQYLMNAARQSQSMNGLNLVDAVTCEENWKLEIGN
jgi:carbamoyl-phosphate synthase small subunit